MQWAESGHPSAALDEGGVAVITRAIDVLSQLTAAALCRMLSQFSGREISYVTGFVWTRDPNSDIPIWLYFD